MKVVPFPIENAFFSAKLGYIEDRLIISRAKMDVRIARSVISSLLGKKSFIHMLERGVGAMSLSFVPLVAGSASPHSRTLSYICALFKNLTTH